VEVNPMDYQAIKSAARRLARELEARFRRTALRCSRARAQAMMAGRALYTHRRQLHRIAWAALPLLWTVRGAFPWTLRVLILVGAFQIPVLPTDEIAAVVALMWIVARYGKLARVIWHAAVMESAR
jgi:hypothetical protein